MPAPHRLSSTLLAVLLSSFGASAWAQGSNPLNPTCMGSNAPRADWGIVIKQSDTNFIDLAQSAYGQLLNKAECECDSQDLFLQARVTMALMQGSQPAFSVWAGSSCTNISSRTQGCEQVKADIGPTDFWAGSSNTHPRQQIHVQAVISPMPTSTPDNPLPHMCSENTINNSMWFLFGDANMPDYCQLTLPADTSPPTAPMNVRAGSGDQAVILEWDAPPAGSTSPPQKYQVLCADAAGNPLPGSGAYAMGDNAGDLHKLEYSTCVNADKHTIQRRVLSTGSAFSEVDGGTSVDMAFGSASPPLQTSSDPGNLDPQADPLDGGVADGSDVSDDGGTDDGGTTTDGGTTSNAACANATIDKVFPGLDKRFVCSEAIQTAGQSFSIRIANLANGSNYFFTIVGVDAAGNPTPSGVVCGVPQPVEDLYRRFRDLGGKPQGFCFIATAAYGSYQSPYVKVLRDFRDQALLPYGWGRAFVEWYYRASPPYAAYITEHDTARWLVRQALWPVIGAAALWLWVPGWLQLLLGGALGGALFCRRWRRARQRGAA